MHGFKNDLRCDLLLPVGDFTIISKLTVFGKGAYVTYQNW